MVSAVPGLHPRPVRLLHGAGGGERPAGAAGDRLRLVRQVDGRHGGVLPRRARGLAGSALDGRVQAVSGSPFYLFIYLFIVLAQR